MPRSRSKPEEIYDVIDGEWLPIGAYRHHLCEDD